MKTTVRAGAAAILGILDLLTGTPSFDAEEPDEHKDVYFQWLITFDNDILSSVSSKVARWPSPWVALALTPGIDKLDYSCQPSGSRFTLNVSGHSWA
jgi:hypothetical protein